MQVLLLQFFKFVDLSFIFLKHVYVCARVRVLASMHHMCAGAGRGQKRVTDPLEMELQIIMGCLTWGLGNRSPARAIHALNRRAISSSMSPCLSESSLVCFLHRHSDVISSFLARSSVVST